MNAQIVLKCPPHGVVARQNIAEIHFFRESQHTFLRCWDENHTWLISSAAAAAAAPPMFRRRTLKFNDQVVPLTRFRNAVTRALESSHWSEYNWGLFYMGADESTTAGGGGSERVQPLWSDSEIAAVAKALSAASELRNVTFHGVANPEAVVSLLQNIADSSKIETLQIQWFPVSDVAACAQLSRFTELTDLSLDCAPENMCHEFLPALSKFTKLRKLHLFHFQLVTDDDVQSFIATLKTFAELRTLELDQLSVPPRGFEYVLSAFPNIPNLKRIHLLRCGLGVDDARTLARMLPQKLYELSIDGNRIFSRGAVALMEALAVCSELRVLGLADNRIGDGGATALAKIMHGLAHLRKLDLRGNRIGDAGIIDIAGMFIHTGRLDTLVVSGNDFSQKGLRGLALHASHLHGLERFEMSNTTLKSSFFSSSGSDDLHTALSKVLVLRHLELSAASGYFSVSECSPRIQSLVVKNNNLTNVDLLSLIPAESQIRILDLDSNNLVKLSAVVERMASLTVLNLRNNRLDSDALAALCRSLKSPSQLESLDISCNRIDSPGVVSLAGEIPNRMKKLNFLDFSDNNIGSDEEPAVVEAFSRMFAADESVANRLDVRGVDFGAVECVFDSEEKMC